jgi:hypothetical protein
VRSRWLTLWPKPRLALQERGVAEFARVRTHTAVRYRESASVQERDVTSARAHYNKSLEIAEYSPIRFSVPFGTHGIMQY